MRHSLFVRQVSTLLTGRVAALVLSLMFVPFVARLYDPDVFGVLAIFLMLAQLLGHVAPLRYFRAALIAREERDAYLLMSMSAVLLVLGAFFIFGVLLIADYFDLNIPLIGPMGWLAYMLPLGMIIHGLRPILNTACTRREAYRTAALADVGDTFLTGLSRIVAGLAVGSSVWGLVVGFFLGGLGRIAIQTRELKAISKCMLGHPSWARTHELSRLYRDYPLSNMPAGVLTLMAGKVPIYMMGMMFSPAVVGLYAMADLLIRMPVISAGTAVREVFMKRISGQALKGGRLRSPLTKLTLGMFALGIIPFSLLGFYGGDILRLLLGEKWVGAGVYVQILAPWYFAEWVNTGIHATLVAMRRQGLWLRRQALILVSRLSVFVVGYIQDFDVEKTLVWFAGINIIIAILSLIQVFILVTMHERARGSQEG